MRSSAAAHVAASSLRLGHKAGPFGPVTAGSGDSPNGAPLQVELFVGGVWTDITSYVMTRDGSGKVTITRGQPDEGTQANPARCAFQLNNRAGQFSPRNPLSPYYGKLGRNQPLRVSVPSGNAKSYRFWGEVSSWPQKWDITGADVWVDLEAAGILRRLGQGKSPIGSTLYLAVTSAASNNPVIAYWPCEDASGATAIASGISGVQPMGINGSPSLAAFTGFVCSAPIPTMGTASFYGAPPKYNAPPSTELNFLLAVPAGGATDKQNICRFTTNGTVPTWEVYYGAASGGFIGMRGRNAQGTVVADTGLGVGPINGLLAMVSAILTVSGPDLNFELDWLQVGSTSIAGVASTATSSTPGAVTSITMAPDGGLSGTSIGHVWLQATDPNFFTLSDALTAYAGEAAGTRISRLCSAAALGFESVGTLSSTAAVGAQSSSTLVSLIQDAATADGGILYEPTAFLGLGYRTRISLENQAAVLALSYSAANLSVVPAPVDDDRYTRNDITVTRTGGSWARATLTSGALSILQPPAGVGTYDDAKTINIQADSQLADQAGWRLHLGTVDEARYPQISVNLAHASFVSNPALRVQALAIHPGDRITISNPPAWLPPDDITQMVIGFSETIDHFEHRLTFNCVPESPYRIAITDDVFYGRADTDGSVLAADAGPTDTTLSVATTTGGPLWTVDPAEMPFDVRVGGERITVTNITGSTSPQQFTVTRSVNGVVKPQPANSDVRLYQPAIAAL